MPSERTTLLIIAIVGLLIIAAAAASISDPAGGGNGFAPPIDWTDPGDDPDSGGLDPGNGDDDAGGGFPLFGLLCFPFLFQSEVQLLLLGGVVAGTLAIWWRTNVLVVFAVSIGILPMFTVIYLALYGACNIDDDPDVDTTGGIFGQAIEGANETAGEAIDVATDPLIMLALLAIIGLIAIGIVVFRDDIQPSAADGPGEQEDDDAVDWDALSAAAGRAASRLERGDIDDTDLDNEIYRAWREMTQLLDVANPESSTPSEFAIAATDAGMDPEDVDALTDLFVAVRYGGRTPTPDREQQAIDVLRRIEADYGGQ